MSFFTLLRVDQAVLLLNVVMLGWLGGQLTFFHGGVGNTPTIWNRYALIRAGSWLGCQVSCQPGALALLHAGLSTWLLGPLYSMVAGWQEKSSTDKLHCASSLHLHQCKASQPHAKSRVSVVGTTKRHGYGQCGSGAHQSDSYHIFYVSFTSRLPGVSFPVSSSVPSFLFLKTMCSLAR